MVMTKVSVSSSTTMEIKKKTKGKRKIDMKKIEQKSSRQVAFSKRRVGLFKKAAEISVLTGAQVAILVTSACGHSYAFRHPNTDVLIDHFLDNNDKQAITTKNSPPSLPMKEFNRHYMEVSRKLEAEKKRRETIPVNSGGLRWYEETVDGLDVEELQQVRCSLEEFKKKVLTRADELMMINKSSAFYGSNVSESMGWNDIVQPVDIPTNSGVESVDGGLNFQYGDELMMINKSSALFGSNVSESVCWNDIVQPVDIPTNTRVESVDGGLNFQYGDDFGSLF